MAGTYGMVGGAGTGLASTGAVVVFGGHAYGVVALVAIAFMLVAVGALCLRLGWRRNRPLNGR